MAAMNASSPATAARRLLLIGCSDGIGLGTARKLVGAGWQVVGLSQSPSPLVHDAYHHEVLDVARPGYRARLAEIVAERGPFEACVYCAGIGASCDLDNLDRDLRVFQVNLMAAVETAAELIPRMVKAKQGHFLVLSSQADGLIVPSHPSYAASKAALSSYFEALALAARPSGVRITNLRFGFVDTKLAKASLRPFLRSVDWAVAVVVRALRRNAIRVTRPRRLVPLTRLLRWLTDWRIRFS
jgi:NAD(P)-dependent dehydrogenase (short-subunit alcohol dehydrogenase family)